MKHKNYRGEEAELQKKKKTQNTNADLQRKSSKNTKKADAFSFSSYLFFEEDCKQMKHQIIQLD